MTTFFIYIIYINMKVFKFLYFTFLIFLICLFFSNCKRKERIIIIKEPNKYDVLVNKKYKLPEDYIPNDLEEVNINYAYEHKYLRHEAKIAFENMAYDASKLGYKIILVSAYRNYQYQQSLYQEYVDTMGIEYAKMCSAEAGHSEHQTGLALDIMGSNGDYNLFSESKEFVWVKENAHKYGFILRYPENKTKITGFKYEPWHYRYVGTTLATYLYENDLTLDEYKEKSNL